MSSVSLINGHINPDTSRKKKAVYQGYNNHDCEAWYKCPECNKCFGSWSIYHQKENGNGTKHYCPYCKTELNGLE